MVLTKETKNRLIWNYLLSAIIFIGGTTLLHESFGIIGIILSGIVMGTVSVLITLRERQSEKQIEQRLDNLDHRLHHLEKQKKLGN